MPIITKIQPQKVRKRVNIYLDDSFGFSLDLENYLKIGLKVGDELEEGRVDQIVRKAEFQKVYEKLLKFAVLRPRSEKEFNLWFRKHKVLKSMQGDLLSKLKNLDLLNDSKFAVWWIRQRMAFRPRSKKALFIELIQKGIDRRTIENVISEEKIDEIKTARRLFDKNSYRWNKFDEFASRKKASGFLQRKGFGWDVIKEVLDGP